MRKTNEKGENAMKLVHLSDLHLGKRVNGFSMMEDQAYILQRILEVIDTEKPQAVLIAGDVYDKQIPPGEAVELLDEFLVKLSSRGLSVFVISGNHDAPERLAFGSRLMDGSGIHLAPVYSAVVEPVFLEDEFGTVGFYMLPFLRPANVRRFFQDEAIQTYTDAIRIALGNMKIDTGRRNVLVTHQFVTGAARSESESISVGGTDNVDVSVFDQFDYVALGHIHGPQCIGRETVRYCGTPLKYAISEKDQSKSVTVVELGPKGQTAVRTVPLTPLRELREKRGSYEELTLRENYEHENLEDYLHIILTDEEDVPNAVGRLRTVYPNLMKLDYDNTRTRAGALAQVPEDLERKSELELFQDFYRQQNGKPMTEEQAALCARLIQEIKEAEV